MDELSLRVKTVGILVIVLVITVVFLVMITRWFWQPRFEKLEASFVEASIDIALGVLNNDIERFDDINAQISAWDDTYRFIVDRNREYIQSNLGAETFSASHISFMLFLNSDGKLVEGRQYDPEKQTFVPISRGLIRQIEVRSPLMHQNDVKGKMNGLIWLPEGPALVSSHPILTSTFSGPVRGTLVLGRYLDVADLKRVAHMDLALRPISDSRLPLELKRAPSRYTDQPLVLPVNDKKVKGYRILKDVNGKPVLALSVIIPRKVYGFMQMSLNFYVWLAILSELAVFMLFYYLLSRFILRRLEYLDQEVRAVSVGKRIPEQLLKGGQDEIAHLARSINRMLAAIENGYQQVLTKEKQYRRMFDESLTANFVATEEGRILLCNHVFVELFGFASEDEACSYNLTALFENKGDACAIKSSLERLGLIKECELKLLKRDGTEVVVVGNLSLEKEEEGNKCYTGFLFDITERKKGEERLKFLSQHDAATGLYNRSYFEETLRRAAEIQLAPVAVIICDIDGLKLVNDTLGNEAGDQLLKHTASILKDCVGEGGIVSRIGGDEFAVLLMPDLAGEAERVVGTIRQRVEEYNGEHPELPLSLSSGCAISAKERRGIIDLYQMAENYMFREKLHRTRSGRNSLVAVLAKTLEARDYITEGHAERLQGLVEKIARRIGLSERQIGDLMLLAQFHDIGKVGIPDRILKKPGPLDAEEREEMQRHSEIGYRIARTAPELRHIADWILMHHEWWDGNGYPLGVKGKDIPIESRILAIADAYDAMTSNRPYRRACSPQQAVCEIMRWAGTQFDPHLAKHLRAIIEEELGQQIVCEGKHP